jgi:hypothetical protein
MKSENVALYTRVTADAHAVPSDGRRAFAGRIMDALVDRGTPLATARDLAARAVAAADHGVGLAEIAVELHLEVGVLIDADIGLLACRPSVPTRAETVRRGAGRAEVKRTGAERSFHADETSPRPRVGS